MDINKIIKNFLLQLKPAKVSFRHLKEKNFDNVFFVGLGGSGLAAKMLIELKDEISLKKDANFIFYEGYAFKKSLPKGKTLAIIVSYSGNTQEALKLAKDFKNKGAKLVFVSTNGRLKRLSELWQIDFIKLSETFSPRFSLGEQFYVLYAILKKVGLASKKLPNLSAIKAEKIIHKAKLLSEKFKKGDIILVYALAMNKFLAYDLKIRLNEDAKILAFSNYLPEAVHNEFLSFLKNKKRVKLIFISGIKKCLFEKHIKAIFKALKADKISFEEINLGGKNLRNYFEQIIFNIAFSYFVAKKEKQDILENSFLKKIKKSF